MNDMTIIAMPSKQLINWWTTTTSVTESINIGKKVAGKLVKNLVRTFVTLGLIDNEAIPLDALTELVNELGLGHVNLEITDQVAPISQHLHHRPTDPVQPVRLLVHIPQFTYSSLLSLSSASSTHSKHRYNLV